MSWSITVLIRILELMFVVGWLTSTLVFILRDLEAFENVCGREEESLF